MLSSAAEALNMTLKDIADLATSLTLIVAALTFVYALVDRPGRPPSVA